jgi:acyl-CoA thioesterase
VQGVQRRQHAVPQGLTMDEEIRSSFFTRVANEGYAGKLGLKLIELTPGHAIVEMVPCKEDTNIFGMVHGGAIFSLMDEAFQISCNSHGTVAVALCVNVVYHNPSEEGRKLQAESREIHRSQKTATYEIRVTDENDVLIASCQALAYRKKESLPFLKGGS